MRSVYLVLGFIFIALGFVGAFLPVLPTTPFLILATTCFARSSPRLESWLLSHPRFGPSLRAWRERGAIPLRAKTAGPCRHEHRIPAVLDRKRAWSDPDGKRRHIHACGTGLRLHQTVGLTAPRENSPSKVRGSQNIENNPMQSSRRPPPSENAT
jgi:hypothetical protein